jgi:hypothetical protein
MPATCSAWLAAAGVDATGLAECAGTPTPRAWQVLEADGRRTQARAAAMYTRVALCWQPAG